MTKLTSVSITAIAAAGLLATGGANAGVDEGYNLPVHVQESQLNGYDFEFVIHNCSEEVEITGIYFENGWEDFFSDDLFDRNLRVDPGPLNFLEGTDSPDLSPWSSSTVSYETPGGLAGVGPDGTATIAFVSNGLSEFSLEDLEAALGGDEGFGIALRTLSEGGNNYQFALVGEHDGCDDGGDGGGGEGGGDGGGDGGVGVPSPSAALMGLALIGMIGQRRRRNND